jgi:hypothetical protein
VQVATTEIVRPLASVNDDVDVILVALSFVIVTSLCDFTSALGAKFASCHAILFPLQPDDVARPYAARSPYDTSIHRFVVESYVILSYVVVFWLNHGTGFCTVVCSIHHPSGLIVYVAVEIYGAGRRELFVWHDHVPTRNCIDEKLGFAGNGTGVVSIVCAAAVKGVPTIIAAQIARMNRLKTMCLSF